MKWLEAEERHRDLIRDGFERLRGLASNRASYLSEPALLDFHCGRILESIKQASGQALWLVCEKDRLAAIVGAAPSPWHSQIYGKSIHKIQPLFAFTQDFETIESFILEFDRFFQKRPGDVYMLRADAADTQLNYAISQTPFVHVGTSVRLALDRKPFFQGNERTLPAGAALREFQPEDLEALQAIARDSHTHSHFFYEPRFSKIHTQNLFAAWVEKCADSVAEKFWVVEAEGKAAGFCIALLSQALRPFIQKTIGVVDFIVVDQNAQGKGLGRILLSHALDWFDKNADIVELRTMVDNRSAIRFYEANGFRLLSSDHHYHRWVNA